MSWHFWFETLAYIVAFRVYLWQRRKAGDFLDTPLRWNIIVAAAIGAAAGSKLLYWFEDPIRSIQHWDDVRYLLAGKTIVGGLLGGTIGVELMKRRLEIRRRTGDLFAVPIAIGIAIGRIGCFLAGKQDDTFGTVTALPWGVDFGDGMARHPVQLYETAAMLALAAVLGRIAPPRFAEGDRFRIFILSYCLWRLLVDFLKPGSQFAGLTVLQWACAVSLAWYSRDLVRILTTPGRSTEAIANG